MFRKMPAELRSSRSFLGNARNLSGRLFFTFLTVVTSSSSTRYLVDACYRFLRLFSVPAYLVIQLLFGMIKYDPCLMSGVHRVLWSVFIGCHSMQFFFNHLFMMCLLCFILSIVDLRVISLMDYIIFVLLW